MPRVQDQITVTHKAGGRDTTLRRIIAYVRKGPFYRQIGVRVVGRLREPIMETYYEHRFLHATKGWRVYAHLPSGLGNAGKRVHGPLAGQKPTRSRHGPRMVTT